ncbi:MAG: hypothetical protein AAGA73_18240, partial [Pseudomonadota bacterium]
TRNEKWQETNPAFSLAGWQRHPVVEDYLRQLQAAADDKAGQGGPLTRTQSGGDPSRQPQATIGRATPDNPIIPARGAARRPIF